MTEYTAFKLNIASNGGLSRFCLLPYEVRRNLNWHLMVLAWADSAGHRGIGKDVTDALQLKLTPNLSSPSHVALRAKTGNS
jgi:hypothetical protein